jgi:hypothetical protein
MGNLFSAMTVKTLSRSEGKQASSVRSDGSARSYVGEVIPTLANDFEYQTLPNRHSQAVRKLIEAKHFRTLAIMREVV